MHRSHKNPSLHVFFSRFEDYLKVNSPSSQRAVTHPRSALCPLQRLPAVTEAVWIRAVWPS